MSNWELVLGIIEFAAFENLNSPCQSRKSKRPNFEKLKSWFLERPVICFAMQSLHRLGFETSRERILKQFNMDQTETKLRAK